MNCDRIDNLLLDYLYGELGPDEARQVEAHLDECPACADKYAELAGVRRLVRGLPEPVPSRMAVNKVLAVAREEAASKRSRRGLGWLKLLAPLCLMVVVGGLVYYELQTGYFAPYQSSVPAGDEYKDLEERPAAPLGRTVEQPVEKHEETPAPAAETAPETAPPVSPQPEPAAPAAVAPAMETVTSVPVAEADRTVGSDADKKKETPPTVTGTTAPPPALVITSRKMDEPKAEAKVETKAAPPKTAAKKPSPAKPRTTTTTMPVVPQVEPEPEAAAQAAPPKTALKKTAPEKDVREIVPPAAPETVMPPALDRPLPEPKGGGRTSEGVTAFSDRLPAPRDKKNGMQADRKTEPAPLPRFGPSGPSLLDARAALDAGQYARAVRICQGLLRQYPSGHPGRAKALLIMAMAYEGQGQSFKAMKAYQALAREAPEYEELAARKARELRGR